MKLIRSVKITLSLVAALLAVTLSAQILYVPGGSGSGISNSATGGVGIGTGSPAEQLQLTGNILLYANANNNGALVGYPSSDYFVTNGVSMPHYGIKWASPSDTSGITLLQSGYFGIEFFTSGTQVAKFSQSGNFGLGVGSTAPYTKLDIRGASGTAAATIQIVGNATSSLLLGQDADGGVVRGQGGGNALKFLVGGSGDRAASGSGSEAIRIISSGNVGIGTTNPTQKLSVNGTIRAKEVIVDTGWSDYVFAPDYKLAPLSEVETHIKENGHLPGIPSAKEVAKHGVSMGEMQSKLLAKIEELTLHQIEQEKRISRQDQVIQLLVRQNEVLCAQAGISSTP